MTAVKGVERKDSKVSTEIQDKSIRLTELPGKDAAVRTHVIGPQTIEGTTKPIEKKPMADFAYAVIKISLAREDWGTQKLKVFSDQVKEQLATIDTLLDLSSELTALPDKESHEVTAKMKDLFAKLEAKKIQIWTGGEKISKEKVSEMKAQVSSQIDKLRTALQTKISTEIQPEVNNLQSINNIVQQIIRLDGRLKEKATQIPR